MKRLALFVCALITGSCFPQLPDELIIDDLRVLAIQVTPASVLLASQPLPTVTIRALTVDPDDPEGQNTTHNWSLDLGDADFEGIEQLEALLPEDVSGPEIELDFSALFGRDEISWALGRLPLSYVVDNGQLQRETIKIVEFLTPELPQNGDDDDSSWGGWPTGDDDDSASGGWPTGDDDDSSWGGWPTGDDDDSASGGWPTGDDDDSTGDSSGGDGSIVVRPPFGKGGSSSGDDDDSFSGGGFPGSNPDGVPPAGLPEEWNDNPILTLIERVDGETWSLEDGTLPGPTEALYVGEVSPDEGLHLRIELVDDQPASLLSIEMFRTTGLAGLPPDPEETVGPPRPPLPGGDSEEEEEDQGNTANFGGGDSPVLDDELFPREFGWTPFRNPNDRVPRLFLVIRDRDGGQTWQEIIPQAAPEEAER